MPAKKQGGPTNQGTTRRWLKCRRRRQPLELARRTRRYHLLQCTSYERPHLPHGACPKANHARPTCTLPSARAAAVARHCVQLCPAARPLLSAPVPAGQASSPIVRGVGAMPPQLLHRPEPPPQLRPSVRPHTPRCGRCACVCVCTRAYNGLCLCVSCQPGRCPSRALHHCLGGAASRAPGFQPLYSVLCTTSSYEWRSGAKPWHGGCSAGRDIPLATTVLVRTYCCRLPGRVKPRQDRMGTPRASRRAARAGKGPFATAHEQKTTPPAGGGP